VSESGAQVIALIPLQIHANRPSNGAAHSGCAPRDGHRECRMRVRASLLVVGLAAFVVCGCGGPRMAQVKGRVMFNGQPVKDADVTFSPAGAADQKETGKPATGHTDENGEFKLSTFSYYDGAIVGKHNVHVEIDPTNPTKCKLTKDLTLEVKSGANDFTIEMDPR
jgi:hypothetical protein